MFFLFLLLLPNAGAFECAGTAVKDLQIDASVESKFIVAEVNYCLRLLERLSGVPLLIAPNALVCINGCPSRVFIHPPNPFSLGEGSSLQLSYYTGMDINGLTVGTNSHISLGLAAQWTNYREVKVGSNVNVTVGPSALFSTSGWLVMGDGSSMILGERARLNLSTSSKLVLKEKATLQIEDGVKLDIAEATLCVLSGNGLVISGNTQWGPRNRQDNLECGDLQGQ